MDERIPFFCLAALISTDIGLVLRLHLPLKWAVVPNLDADPGPDSIAAKPKLCSDATKIPNLVVSDPPRASAFSFFIALFYFLLKTGRPKQSQGRDELKGSLHRNRKNWVNRTQYQGIVPYPVMRHSLKERRQRLLEAENLIFFTESTLYNTSMKQEETFLIFMVHDIYECSLFILLYLGLS